MSTGKQNKVIDKPSSISAPYIDKWLRDMYEHPFMKPMNDMHRVEIKTSPLQSNDEYKNKHSILKKKNEPKYKFTFLFASYFKQFRRLGG